MFMLQAASQLTGVVVARSEYNTHIRSLSPLLSEKYTCSSISADFPKSDNSARHTPFHDA